MADEQNQPSEEQVAEAKSLGWAPKEAWRGAPEKWVDADQFLERGMGIHHLRDQNTQLSGKLTATAHHVSELEASLQAATAAINALEESHAEDVKEQVEAARKELKTQLAAASRDGDHEAVADLTEKMTQLNTADDAAEDKGDKVVEKKGLPPLHPEVIQWYKDNPDFASDARKNALANVIATEMRQAGDKTVGKAFLDNVAIEVDKLLGKPAGQRPASKVESGNGGGGRGGSGGDGVMKTYADLPAEAKAACDKAGRRLIGPDKVHKNEASWRASYVKQYYAE